MQAIIAGLWKILVDVFVELLNREDVVADEVEPTLDTLESAIDDADLVRRYGGLLDTN